jgi:TfoX/Sxy family transcriptional regulator of competence genes
MAYSRSLAERIQKVLSRRSGFAEKKMFGGVGFLLNGNMCVGVWKDSLIVRLGVEEAEAAREDANVVPFDITGTALKGWAMVEADGLERDEQLRGWIEQAERFVNGLPAKSAKSKKATRRPRGKRVAATRHGRRGRSTKGK